MLELESAGRPSRRWPAAGPTGQFSALMFPAEPPWMSQVPAALAGLTRPRGPGGGPPLPLGPATTGLYAQVLPWCAKRRTSHVQGRTGPSPAPVRSMTAAISPGSSRVSRSEAAGSQPLTWPGLRAPAIAPLTPGQASVQPTATAAWVTPCRLAIGRRASATRKIPVKAGRESGQTPPPAVLW